MLCMHHDFKKGRGYNNVFLKIVNFGEGEVELDPCSWKLHLVQLLSQLQRSLSRKGSQRLGDWKLNNNATLYDKDTVPAICSPKGTLVGPFTPEKPAGMAVGPMGHSMNPHVHNLTADNIPTESKCSITRRNSFRRPSSWAIDPKRVLLFFATLSSMGTMLLIYFTLTISKQSAEEYGG
ncbi:hypothetical protein D0Y65_002482 [Glycine soja]|uniref:Uncharacterized protein n=1 Tax=Glycine soja TaxID=3848 RepID=A0A445M7X5_GLYSO|nr:hypothetical protein D0Y65_002482 [Glycine soja]RZC31649.1 hypothetical protein D0Y65_002482 [Glycine soja]RZC31650.1 hypothetical protein D0Y65_002482 [Glycine soja]